MDWAGSERLRGAPQQEFKQFLRPANFCNQAITRFDPGSMSEIEILAN